MERRGLRGEPVGSYRRGLRIDATDGIVKVAMEDDVHHFELTLVSDGAKILEVDAVAHRTPWAVCAGAVLEIKALEGQFLDSLPRMPPADKAEQCLHLMDLALLAASHARETNLSRSYLIEVDHTRSIPAASMWCDGVLALSWEIADGLIQGSCFHGIALAALPQFLEAHSADRREAVLILRRASLISYVRRFDLDAFDHADTLNPVRRPICFAQQKDKRSGATRIVGGSRDFYSEESWPLDSRRHSKNKPTKD